MHNTLASLQQRVEEFREQHQPELHFLAGVVLAGVAAGSFWADMNVLRKQASNSQEAAPIYPGAGAALLGACAAQQITVALDKLD